ncbi:MAG: HDOD domain-containing protein [candidate division Zixibacteria bacterium]|nr:HDOD domain-containing protein [candidate division Zixibacteria bacterium]
MVREARKEMPKAPDYEVELHALGFHHAHVGGFLGKQWKLPARLLNAVAWHHHPQQCQSDDCLPHLVHIGNYLAKKTFSSDADQGQVEPVDPLVLEYMGVDDEQLDQMGDQLREEYLKAETFMSMAGVN